MNSPPNEQGYRTNDSMDSNDEQVSLFLPPSSQLEEEEEPQPQEQIQWNLHSSTLLRNSSHNSATSTTSSNSITMTHLTPAIQKISRAIPYQSQSQKRARWIPGARYFPLLFVQWLWHPISVLVDHFKQDYDSDEQQHHHHHDAHHHPHAHHHHNEPLHSSPLSPPNPSSHSHGVMTHGSNKDIFLE